MSADDRVTAVVENKSTGATVRKDLGTWRDVWSEPLAIGRGASCQIHLDSDEVCEVQARLNRLGHHHFVEVVEGAVTCVGRTDSTPGAKWRISGIGDPEPVEVGPFLVTICTGSSKTQSVGKPWWKFWRGNAR